MSRIIILASQYLSPMDAGLWQARCYGKIINHATRKKKTCHFPPKSPKLCYHIHPRPDINGGYTTPLVTLMFQRIIESIVLCRCIHPWILIDDINHTRSAAFDYYKLLPQRKNMPHESTTMFCNGPNLTSIESFPASDLGSFECLLASFPAPASALSALRENWMNGVK